MYFIPYVSNIVLGTIEEDIMVQNWILIAGFLKSSWGDEPKDLTQLAECLPGTHKVMGRTPARPKLNMVAHAHLPNPQKTEAGESGVSRLFLAV